MNLRRTFERITADPRYISRLDWGEPREGHPEGTIRAHIAELEANLETLRPRLSEADWWKLRILIHVHDIFKPDAKTGVRIADPMSHASLARSFAAEYFDDADLLAMIQRHDEPYALYRQVEHRGRYEGARLEALLGAIQDWDLYSAFLIIDGCTPGKSRAPLRWFFREIRGRVRSGFGEDDLIG